MTTVYQFDIQSVHDPNGIRVSPRIAYYRRGYPKPMKFQVDFMNKAEGEVKDVKAQVVLDEGLDIQTLQVTATDPPCRICPKENYEDSVCYRIQRYDNPVGKDSVVVTLLHNIYLGGKGST